MYFHVNDRSGLKSPLIADDIYEIIMKVCSRRDFLLIALISGSGD
jgi:ribonucleoside-diphosphate reductase subunit M1